MSKFQLVLMWIANVFNALQLKEARLCWCKLLTIRSQWLTLDADVAQKFRKDCSTMVPQQSRVQCHPD